MQTFYYKNVKIYVDVMENVIKGKFNRFGKRYEITSRSLMDFTRAYKGIISNEYDLSDLKAFISVTDYYKRRKRKQW